MNRTLVAVIVAILLVGGFSYWYIYRYQGRFQDSQPEISSFEECVAAGNPVLETFPPQCQTSDGQVFTQDISNANDLRDKIMVESPVSSAIITSPVMVKGQARGSWYFEGSFPVKIVDGNGNILGQTPLEAIGKWMTEDFVPFNGQISFSTPQTETGAIVLMKDNPSGLPENDEELVIPVRFK